MKKRNASATILAGVAQVAMAACCFAQDGVKIGVLSDFSGPYAEITGKSAVKARQLAIADFGGKALGQPVTMVSADHQNKADVGLAIARNGSMHEL